MCWGKPLIECAVMNKYTYKTKKLIDISKSNWLNLIPDITGKDVLKVGTNRIDNILPIAYSGPKSFYCIGDSIADQDGYISGYYSNVNDVPLDAFDLVIIDESEYITSIKSYKKIKEILVKISQIIRNKGTLLLCFPDGLLSMKYRYWINKALSSTKFNNGNYFLCDPSAENPVTIVPCHINSRWLICDIPFNEKPFTFKVRVKAVLKRLLFSITKKYNPLRGLILIAEKSKYNKSYYDYAFNKIENVLNNKNVLKEDVKLIMICITAHYVRKYYIFFYNILNFHLLLIIKINYKSSRKIDDLRQEYENMIMLSNCIKKLSEKNIKVPCPIHSDFLQEKDITIQSAVSGISVSWILEKHKHLNDQKTILMILDRLTDIQVFLQEVCSHEIIDSVYAVGNEYFNNYMCISYDWKKHDQSAYLAIVQHGDFAVNNIFFDTNTNEWGIIDWEWMGKGYPPLFDLFSLFTSVRFVNKNSSGDVFDKYYISFVHTYFDNNWFSEYLNKLVKRYCKNFNLNSVHIYTFFITYLLFYCNKYKMSNLLQFRRLYEKMLTYAVNNDKAFVLK